VNSPLGVQRAAVAVLFAIFFAVHAQETAPTITTDLQDMIRGEGVNLRLQVFATGSSSNAFYWYHNGALIAGPSSNSVTYGAAGLAQAGNYYVVASNSVGTAVSRTNSVWIVPRGGPGMIMENDRTWEMFTNKHMHAFAEDVRGNILVGGASIVRLRSDLTRDETFKEINAGADKYVYEIVATSDGGLYACGDFTLSKVSGVARFDSTGVIDTNFNAGFSTATTIALKTLLPVEGDRLMVGGTFQIRTASRTNLALLMSDGKVDPSFNPPTPAGVVYDIARATNGDYIIAGAFGKVGTNTARALARLRPDGSLATVYPIIFGHVRQIVSEPDDSVIAVGEFRLSGQAQTIGLARFRADGSYDASLPPQVITTTVTEDQLRPLIRLNDGRIIAATLAFSFSPTAETFFPNGTRDTNFFCGLQGFETIFELRDGSFLGGGFLTMWPGIKSAIPRSASVVRLFGDPDRRIDFGGGLSGSLQIKTVATHYYTLEKAADVAGEWKLEEEFEGDGTIHEFANRLAGTTNLFYRLKIGFGN
jgi:hypothetical protein